MKLFLHLRSPVATHALEACRDWKWVILITGSVYIQSEKNAVIIIIFVSSEVCLQRWENFNQLKTKHTITVFLGGAYFCHLPSLHVCQHGWRSRRKTTGDGWETTRLQTLPAWTSAVSLCVLGLEPWLPLHHRDVFLHWESKFCCFGFKHRVTLWPNSQRICHRWLPNFI